MFDERHPRFQAPSIPHMHAPARVRSSLSISEPVGFEKKNPKVYVQRLHSSDGSEPARPQPQPWETGFRRRFPWIGFWAILIVLASSLNAIVLLKVSDGKSECHWPKWIAPNVILAGLNSASNLAITLAVAQGKL